MPVENMEEEGLAKIPDLRLAQAKFQLQDVDKFKVRRVGWALVFLSLSLTRPQIFILDTFFMH